MTMPSTGVLNMGGTSSPVSVAQELGRSLTATISMNEAAVRTLAGVSSTSGTSWSMNSLYGKSNRTLAFNNANTFIGSTAGIPCSLTLTFTSTGTITTALTGTGSWTAPSSFISPTGDTTGMSIRCHFTSITQTSPGFATVSVFGTTISTSATSYDSGYVSFGGTNKVITGSSSAINAEFYASGTIYITDGTTTISRAFSDFSIQV